MTDPDPNLPELYRLEQAPSFHVSSITRDAGSMSPFGDHLEFPLPVETLGYVHPGPEDRPNLAGV